MNRVEVSAPLLSTSQMLSDAEVLRYREEGYLVVRGKFTANEVHSWQHECEHMLTMEDIIHEFNWRTFFRKFPRGIWMLEKFDPVIDISPIFKALSEDSRIIDVVAQLANDQAVHLFKDKLIFKAPQQHGYPLHQDYNWWHAYPPEDLCTAVIAIDPAGAENGAIEFFKCCHDRMLLPEGEYRGLTAEEAEQIADAESDIPELEPGDFVVFHSLTPHCSSQNLSKTWRRTFYPSYVTSRVGNVYLEHAERQRQHLLNTMDPYLREAMRLI